MLGLMYLGAAALYLGLMLFVVSWAWRKGRAGSGSLVKAGAFALAGFLAVYLPVFWNHIPIVLAHRSMCAKDAGFKVHVTPAQWEAKNKDVLGSLRGVDLDKTTPSRTLASGFSRYEFFGGVLARETKTQSDRLFGMNVVRAESKLLDARTGDVLTSSIGYAVGPREDARIWLTGYSCPQQAERQMDPAVMYNVELKELIK
jgi:hypothetical protein